MPGLVVHPQRTFDAGQGVNRFSAHNVVLYVASMMGCGLGQMRLIPKTMRRCVYGLGSLSGTEV